MREINNKNGAIFSSVFIIILTTSLIIILNDKITFLIIIQRLSTAFTIYGILLILFIKWIWKNPIFKGWLVLIPDISGKWSGIITSTYIKSESWKENKQIKIKVIIKQELFSLSVVMKSKEMKSESYIAAFDIDKSQNRNRICYSYTSKPKPEFRKKSPIHDGTALLDIIGIFPKKLEGEYWTTRETVGSIKLLKKK